MYFISKHAPEDIFAKVPDSDRGKVRIKLSGYMVKVSSQRLITFKRSPSCVVCGITGDMLVLEFGGSRLPKPGDKNQGSPHLNFYAKWDDSDIKLLKGRKSILMTKDHIVPRSKGGTDALDNYQTMCFRCNEFKGSLDVNPEEIRHLMSMWHSGAGGRPAKIEVMTKYLNSLNKEPGRFVNGKVLYEG